MRINSKDISVIIQGPFFNIENCGANWTENSILSVKNLLPEAEIIFSTWKGNYDLKSIKVDKLVLSDDPGSAILMLNGKSYGNINRQILSTKNGINVANRKFLLKLRSDSVLLHLNFLNYFNKFNLRNKEYLFFSKHVLTCNVSSFNPNKFEKRLFNPSDWFFFGYKRDIKKLFNIPLQDNNRLNGRINGNSYDHKLNLTAEQYIWTSLIKKHLNLDFNKIFDFSNEFKKISESSIANNLVILSAKQIGIESYKYKNSSQFVKFMECYYYYSHYDWLRLYFSYVTKRTNLLLLIVNIPFSWLFLIINYKIFRLGQIFKAIVRMII
jgi:hypothetical protein